MNTISLWRFFFYLLLFVKLYACCIHLAFYSNVSCFYEQKKEQIVLYKDECYKKAKGELS